MLKQTTVTVSGTDYLLTAYPATRGLKYQKRLAKILLPAFAEITRDAEGKDTMSAALEKLADHIEELDEDMIKEMVVQGASKNGVQISFDYEFSSEYLKLFELLKEIIKFNFSSVFTALGSVESL